MIDKIGEPKSNYKPLGKYIQPERTERIASFEIGKCMNTILKDYGMDKIFKIGGLCEFQAKIPVNPKNQVIVCRQFK